MEILKFDDWFGKVTYAAMDAVEIAYQGEDDRLFTTFLIDNARNEIAVCTSDYFGRIIDMDAKDIPLHEATIIKSTYQLPDYEDDERVHKVKMEMIGEVQEPHFQIVSVYSKEELKDTLMDKIYENVEESHMIYTEIETDLITKPFTPRFTVPYLRHKLAGKKALTFNVQKYGYLMQILLGKEEYKFIDFICELGYIISYTQEVIEDTNETKKEIEKLAGMINDMELDIRVSEINMQKVLQANKEEK